jgi:hypothetical protein
MYNSSANHPWSIVQTLQCSSHAPHVLSCAAGDPRSAPAVITSILLCHLGVAWMVSRQTAISSYVPGMQPPVDNDVSSYLSLLSLMDIFVLSRLQFS